MHHVQMDLPAAFAFPDLAWTTLNRQLGALYATSALTYLTGVIVSPPSHVAESLDSGGTALVITRSGLFWPSAVVCAGRQETVDHLCAALLVHVQSGGKVRVKTTLVLNAATWNICENTIAQLPGWRSGDYTRPVIQPLTARPPESP